MNERKTDSLSLIVAMTRARVIGMNGTMPWHYPEDLRHFKRQTLDHSMIMGRRTFESLPGVLPKRPHLVLSSQAEALAKEKRYQHEDVHLFGSLEEARAFAQPFGRAFVIGGGQIYAAALPFVDELWITWIEEKYKGDTYFPEFNLNDFELERSWQSENAPLTFAHYIRRALS